MQETKKQDIKKQEVKQEKRIIKTYKDLNVFQQSYQLANVIYGLTRKFPKEETYSLTQQLLRSSRSIPSNIVEGWAKRKYENIFIRHLVDANGSCEETKIWLDFAKDHSYISVREHEELFNRYNQIGAMLHSLIERWEAYPKMKG